MRSRNLPDELWLPTVPVEETLLRIVVVPIGAALISLMIVVLLIQNVWSLGMLLSLRCGVLLVRGVCPTACYVLRVEVSGQADTLTLDQRASQLLLLVAEGGCRAVTD